jgi:hypothetical protein
MNSRYDRILDRISLKALTRIVSASLAVLGAACGLFFFGPGLDSYFRYRAPYFAGNEVAEWHIMGGDRVVVHSRITLSKCLPNTTFMPIELPYESGKIESVTLDGRPVAYEDITGTPDAESGLYLALDTPGPALQNRLIEVVWSLPMSELPWEDGCGYRIQLKGLIPVRSYALVTILEEGCGFEVNGNTPGLRMYHPFSCIMRGYKCWMGSCGLGIRPIQVPKPPPA